MDAAFAVGRLVVDTAGYKVDAGRRTGPGTTELHDRDTDVMYVLEGRATVVTGDRRRQTTELAPGDLFVIPAMVPHTFTAVERSVPLPRRQGDVVTVARPPQLLPGRPDAIVDLRTHAGAALVGAEWRYADATIDAVDFVAVGEDLGPSGPPTRTYDVAPHAEAPDFDDSGWRRLAPPELELRLGAGLLSANWYRTSVTIPDRLGDLDPTGATIVFEVVVDDYAEVWVNGELPKALGDTGGNVASGFNAPNRVVLTRDARPGQRFDLAVFGVNGPISASPHNYIWVRSATLDVYAPERARVGEPAALEIRRLDDRLDAVVPPGTVLERIATRVRVHRRPGVDAAGRCCSAPPTRTPSTAGRRRAGSRCSARRAATPASTSAATTSPAPTASPSTPTGCWRSASTASGVSCASTRTATSPCSPTATRAGG